MNDTKEQVTEFLNRCEELKKCRFIMATTKIKDLLKCIVNSPDLYKLFDTVTKDFNYIEAKNSCLVTANDGGFRKSYIILPHTVGQRLAFIFCLLVEFDKDTINFNDFLRKYFPEDGSYFESYQAFCKTIIDNLEEILKQVFKDKLEKSKYEEEKELSETANSAKSSLISEISIAIEGEKQNIAESFKVPKEEKDGGIKILSELFTAVKKGDVELINALIFGYNYFVLYYKCVSENVAYLIEMIAEYEKLL